MSHPAHINSLGGQQAEGHLRSRRDKEPGKAAGAGAWATRCASQ